MIQSKLTLLPVNEILLDEENPRIKQYLEYYDEITSEMIALALTDSSDSEAITSYRALKDSIKTSGGIIHPILVNHDAQGQYIVIEGNTRTQIYREFKEHNVPGDWNSIPALVYEQLSELQKHEIRLQSHLVGPRDWNAYSKAKYLYNLSVNEGLPMNQIISMCGGKASEINKFIQAYEYMERYYRPYVNEKGYDFDTREFSKIAEYLNPRVQGAVTRKGFAENQFAKWVADGNINKAQAVRSIPAIMKNDEALSVFLKDDISSAEKVVHAAELKDADLSEYPYEKLAKELRIKLEILSGVEIKNLANNDAYADKREELDLLHSKLDFIFEMIADVEH